MKHQESGGKFLNNEDIFVRNHFFSAAHVQIFIIDQNDNYPEFTQSVYNVTIPENSEVGTFITQIKAHDKDSEDFGTMGIRYKNLRGGIAHL